MSIPVDKRDLGDGWVLSCNGKEGGDLTLTDVTIRRENVVCQILGGDTLFFPMFDDANGQDNHGDMTAKSQKAKEDEDCVLHHIRALLVNAQGEGVWNEGIGGVCQVCACDYFFASSCSNTQFLFVSPPLIDMPPWFSKAFQFQVF